MTPFLHAHAAHPDWRVALALAGAQLDAQQARRRQRQEAAEPLLGFAYFSDRYATQADALYAALHDRWPGVDWVGACGVGVAGSGVEYFDEPALALMLAPLPPGRFHVYSGARPLAQIEPYTALVHADPGTPELSELIAEMSDRTASGYVFGGLVSTRTSPAQIACGVLHGGLSGVAFSRDVALVSRVTQGCQPVGPVRHITAADGHVITQLDGQPALDCLLHDLRALQGQHAGRMSTAVSDTPPGLHGMLVGLSDERAALLVRPGQFGTNTRVRHLIGIDPHARGVAVAERVEPGMQLAFCRRDVQAARRDLVRICSEIREELSPEDGPEGDAAERIAGAIYISCAGRGGPHFGAPSAELQIVQRALGDVPLVGFFAGGEIGHQHLYGYTGVLTVFARGG